MREASSTNGKHRCGIERQSALVNSFVPSYQQQAWACAQEGVLRLQIFNLRPELVGLDPIGKRLKCDCASEFRELRPVWQALKDIPLIKAWRG
ncbi:hypothetical protein D3C78_1779280 [compost metagenome]